MKPLIKINCNNNNHNQNGNNEDRYDNNYYHDYDTRKCDMKQQRIRCNVYIIVIWREK